MSSSDASEHGEIPGWHTEWVARTGSTNADLLAAVEAGAPDRSVLRTDHQTTGRGRLDRRWDAPPGANLLVSILFRLVPAAPAELTRRVALAARQAAATYGVDVGLKWPNDLLVDGRKLAGILAQRHASGPVVVGLGFNVGWAPEGATCLAEHLAEGAAPTPADLLIQLLGAYDRLPVDPGRMHERYRSALTTRGRRVRVIGVHGDVEGTALDVEVDGRLVVLDACGVTHRFDVGDVVHLR